MKLKTCFATFLFISSFSFGQINLVQNPSFETISICPNGSSLINHALHWDTLKSGGGGTPDLYNACNNPSSFGVPHNAGIFVWNYQPARTGIGYCGFIVSYPGQNVREYIQNKLSSTLIAGKTYCVKFFVNPDWAQYAIDRFGAYLDNGAISSVSYNIITLNPQVENPVNQFLNDTLNWVPISGTFIANGAEQYITIGNFATNAQTDTVTLNPTAFNHDAYYFVDDVSIIPTDLPAYAGKDTSMCTGDSVYVGRPPEIGLDNIWTNTHGDNVGTGAGVWVKPDTTTTYIVTQDLCGTITYDTVKVVVNCIGVEQFNNKTQGNIFPNPANNVLNIECAIKQGQFIITDLFGNRIVEGSFNEKKQVDISELNQGIYFIEILSIRSNFSQVRKLMIRH